MKPGAGKQKGSNFEREVAAELSKWISKTRTDLFRRTVLSGGQFTQSKNARGEPGDLGPNDPKAFPFISRFVVECKHWAYLELIDVIWKNHELYSALLKVQKEAKDANKEWMLIARQNRRPTLLFLPVKAVTPSAYNQVDWHALFNGTIYVFKFADYLAQVPPSEVIPEYKVKIERLKLPPCTS